MRHNRTCRTLVFRTTVFGEAAMASNGEFLVTTLCNVTDAAATHRHGHEIHSHPHAGPHRHLRLRMRKSAPLSAVAANDVEESHGHSSPHDHGHSHGLVDRSIVRSREGVKAVAVSLAILGVTAFLQLAIFLVSNSVALLADLVTTSATRSPPCRWGSPSSSAVSA